MSTDGISIHTQQRPAVVLLLGLTLFTAVLYFITSGEYGIFRDELYYFACGEHLDWGYVDHPPMVAFIAAGSRALFGDWLPGLRLPATLAIAATVFLAGWTAWRLGAGAFGQGLAALAVIIAPVYQGMSNFLSMNAFDLLFWAAIILAAVEMIKRDEPRLWLLIGLLAGLGLLNKYSVLFLMTALALALLLTPLRRHLATPWPWIGGAIALLMLAPNLLWQNARGWPFIGFQANITEDKMAWISTPYFLFMQVLMMQPPSLLVWGGGLAALLFWKPLRPYRLFGLAWLIVMALYLLKGSKVYYPAPTYLMLFPAGAVFFDHLFRRPRRRWGKPALVGLLVIGGLITLPYGLPVLPVDTFIAYDKVMQLEGSSNFEDGRRIPLRQHYADRFGWEEMVQEVARVYHSLSPEEQRRATIIGNNYGDAGAIDFYRHKYDLPAAVSDHLTYWFWGYGDNTADILITCGRHRREELEQGYEEVIEAGYVSHPYAIFYENDYPIFLCRGRKFDLAEQWSRMRNNGY